MSVGFQKLSLFTRTYELGGIFQSTLADQFLQLPDTFGSQFELH